jgi:hypothetical protein
MPCKPDLFTQHGGRALFTPVKHESVGCPPNRVSEHTLGGSAPISSSGKAVDKLHMILCHQLARPPNLERNLIPQCYEPTTGSTQLSAT